jgi:2,3-bisphosphoglycerate-dependent phosphoglycerate mutase
MRQADDDAARGTLILLRHGESTANAEGSFTGLRDVDLSERGVAQSHDAAALLGAEGLRPDVVFTSQMRRARRTAELLLADLHDVEAPMLTSWRLNERDYGLLTGMPKHEVRERFGQERFHTWRRTLHGTPPPMAPENRASVDFVEHGPRSDAEDHPADDLDSPAPSAPGDGESLHDVVLRVRPLWAGPLRERLRRGQTVLVVAHGNSLRALCSIVDELSDADLEELNLPTAQPIVYEVASDGQAMPRGGRFLDPDTAVLAAIRIAFEGGT